MRPSSYIGEHPSVLYTCYVDLILLSLAVSNHSRFFTLLGEIVCTVSDG